MKFTATFVIAVLAVTVSARPIKRDVDPALVPEFGLAAGLNPTGTGDCDGINGIKIPCSCPPERGAFLASLNANINAGRAVNNPGVLVSFPTDNSKASKLARLNAATVTLQNLNGPGVGCPQAATTFGAQRTAIENGADAPAPAPAPAAPAPAPPAPAPANNPSNAGGVDPALVPEFGLQSGLNPTGTGDCDGINGIKIPCTCPPSRQSFIQSLNANVAAGQAVNNPTVKLSFPTDNSKASKLARLNAATVTLQNLNGPGVGCPQAATTFGAQRTAIENGTDAPAPAPVAPAPAPPAPAPANNPSNAGGVDPALVPEFGLQSGLNPTGTGDCDGINGIKIPCTCPPSRESFIQSLNANVAAGQAVNNPSVKLSFPIDNSKASKLARLNAATVTLQNLNGPGVGCPQAATTFGAQRTAIEAGP